MSRRHYAISIAGRASRRAGQLEDIATRIAKHPAPAGFRMIPGFDARYSVSRSGEVYSHFHGRLMNQLVNSGGYFTVTLTKGGHATKRPYEVHVLMMLAFVGPVPSGHEVDHEDRVKSHNTLDNLRYVTRPMNCHNALKAKRINKTVFRGVVFKQRNRLQWEARIRGTNNARSGGLFSTDREAAEAYDEMALREFGPTAVTNKSLGLL